MCGSRMVRGDQAGKAKVGTGVGVAMFAFSQALHEMLLPMLKQLVVTDVRSRLADTDVAAMHLCL